MCWHFSLNRTSDARRSFHKRSSFSLASSIADRRVPPIDGARKFQAEPRREGAPKTILIDVSKGAIFLYFITVFTDWFYLVVHYGAFNLCYFDVHFTLTTRALLNFLLCFLCSLFITLRLNGFGN